MKERIVKIITGICLAWLTFSLPSYCLGLVIGGYGSAQESNILQGIGAVLLVMGFTPWLLLVMGFTPWLFLGIACSVFLLFCGVMFIKWSITE